MNETLKDVFDTVLFELNELDEPHKDLRGKHRRYMCQQAQQAWDRSTWSVWKTKASVVQN